MNKMKIKDMPTELQEDLSETFSKLIGILMMQAEIKGIRTSTSWYGRGLSQEDQEAQVKSILTNKYQGETLTKYLKVLSNHDQ